MPPSKEGTHRVPKANEYTVRPHAWRSEHILVLEEYDLAVVVLIFGRLAGTI